MKTVSVFINIPHAQVYIYTHKPLLQFPSCTQLSIYQVTDSELCSKLLELFNKGVNVTILASHNVIPPYNREKAWVRAEFLLLINGNSITHDAGMLQESDKWRDEGKYTEFLHKIQVQP